MQHQISAASSADDEASDMCTIVSGLYAGACVITGYPYGLAITSWKSVIALILQANNLDVGGGACTSGM